MHTLRAAARLHPLPQTQKGKRHEAALGTCYMVYLYPLHRAIFFREGQQSQRSCLVLPEGLTGKVQCRDLKDLALASRKINLA